MKGVFEKKEHFGLIGLQVAGFRGYSPMFHTHGELILVTKGSLSMVVDGEDYCLKAGELSILFPYLVHSYEEAPDVEAILVLFDPGETAFDKTFLTKKPTCPIVPGESFAPLLERSDKRIVEIMLDCGFQNQSSFNRIFREVCGCCPREYQKAQRSKLTN